MANYFDTGILLTAGFSLSSQAPLDGRSVVELLTDLDTHIAENRAYEGMCVYVKENKKIYIYNGTTWEEFVGGGSSEEQIKDWVSGSSYLEGDYIYHEGEIYRCLTSNSDVDFDETNWEQITYGIDELSKEDVERLLGLTEEEIEAMEGLILDTEVRIDKTYSSSKIYADIQQCLEDSKTYTLEEIAKIGTASYKIVTDVADMTEERYLYLLHDGATNYDIYVVEADGTPTKIGSTQIDLSNYYTKEEVDELLEANAVDLSGYTKTYTSLSELGLTAPVTVGEIFNAMPNKTMTILSCEDITDHITDVPMAYGVLTIKRGGDGRFSIDYQNSLFGSPCDVKRWIGTLKGSDGTGLYWKQLSAEPTFVALKDIGLTTDATFQDVIDALPKGGSALLGVKDFTNYQTIFPYEEGNDQFARVYIVKGVADGSCMFARWFRKDGSKEAIAIFNINDNKFNGWKQIRVGGAKTAIFNSKTFKIDITKGSASWNGNLKFGYVVDNSYGEIIISSLGTRDVTWSCSDGVNFVKSVTYTIDPDNNTHVTIGVELFDIVYGVHHLETAGNFATINSFTADAFTGTSVAGRGTARGRNNGVGILCNVADLGLTTPCTTIQIAQAIRNLTNAGNRIPRNGIIGMFDNDGNTITDAPSQYGLLQINAYGYDRIMIRYEGIGSSSHTGSWIGQIKGSGGVFSDIIWKRVCTTSVNDVPVTTVTTSNLSSNKITAGTVSYCVKNGVCYVYLDGIRYSEVGTNVSVLENMPKALITSGAHAGKSSSDTTLTQYCFIVKNETTLKLHCFKAGDTGYCSFSYPVAE